MSLLHTITESDLKALAREATTLFLGGRADPTGAVIKVASAYEYPLTNEHVRRVCEMTYHDAFEQMFRSSPGPDKLVSFDPPDAEKVASAIRAAQIQSFSDKVASARGGEMHKVASTETVRTPPPLMTKNAFLVAVSAPAHTAHMKKEARAAVVELRGDLHDAYRQLEVEVRGASGSAKYAFADLAESVLSVVNNGVPPVDAVAAVVEFAKVAAVENTVLAGVAEDLFSWLAYKGVDLASKTAGIRDVTFNDRHPIRLQAIKVAELRGFKVAGQIALEDLKNNLARVERELQDVLFS